jgi:glycerol uptake facilitator-like aquaporin
MTNATARALAAEFTGSAMLLSIIVGSGIMGERLSQGNMAIALLANSFATGCGLFVLVVVFAPVSGAEFNPLVTLLNAFERSTHVLTVALTLASQVAGAIVGVWIAHAMFALPILARADKLRGGMGPFLAEAIATFGLILTIVGVRARGPVVTGAAVGAYIAAAYWFTASTSFANPSVTLARALTPTFSGIAPSSVPTFLAAQGIGAFAGYFVAKFLGFSGQPVPE